MKQIIIIIIILGSIVMAIPRLIEPIIAIQTKKELEKVFTQSKVSVGKCIFRPTKSIALQDISINKKGSYDIHVKTAAVQYKLSTIFRPGALRLSLNDAAINVHTPKENINKLARNISLKVGKSPLFGYLTLSGLKVDISTKDLTIKGTVSAGVRLRRQTIDTMEVKTDIFKMQGVELSNIFLKTDSAEPQGDFGIAKIKYNDLNIYDMNGKIKLQGKEIIFSDFSANSLGGKIGGNLNIKIDKEVVYLLNLICTDIDIQKLVTDFKLKEKFDMTGLINGGLNLKGNGINIELLSGGFSVVPPGGIMSIKDTKFLENMAKSTDQPVELIVESFRNYKYNTGMIVLSFKENDVLLDMNLDGNAGKRTLNVIMHNFNSIVP